MSTNGTGRRVVITGLGAVTPLGTDVPTHLGGARRRSTRACVRITRVRPEPGHEPDRRRGARLRPVPSCSTARRSGATTARRSSRWSPPREALADAGLPARLEGELAEADRHHHRLGPRRHGHAHRPDRHVGRRAGRTASARSSSRWPSPTWPRARRRSPSARWAPTSRRRAPARRPATPSARPPR